MDILNTHRCPAGRTLRGRSVHPRCGIEIHSYAGRQATRRWNLDSRHRCYKDEFLLLRSRSRPIGVCRGGFQYKRGYRAYRGDLPMAAEDERRARKFIPRARARARDMTLLPLASGVSDSVRLAALAALAALAVRAGGRPEIGPARCHIEPAIAGSM
jgi:hypothetical protein